MAWKSDDARREYQRLYYATDTQRKKRREYQQELRRDPKRQQTAEKLRDAVRRYRVAFRRRVFDKDNGRCHYCLVEIDFATFWMDHKHPRRYNGPTVIGNLVAACQPCNRRKGYKHSYESFMGLMNPNWIPPWIESNGHEPPEAGSLGD